MEVENQRYEELAIIARDHLIQIRRECHNSFEVLAVLATMMSANNEFDFCNTFRNMQRDSPKLFKEIFYGKKD